MRIGELAARVNRSVDTLKRWEGEGLLASRRDERGHRIYEEHDVIICRELAAMALEAQRCCQKLRFLAEAIPEQLDLPLLTADAASVRAER